MSDPTTPQSLPLSATQPMPQRIPGSADTRPWETATRPQATPVSRPSAVRAAPAPLEIDRIRCSGHGVCAQLLPGLLTLDEWGYPIVEVDGSSAAPRPSERDLSTAVTLCPARALRLRG